MKIKRDKPCQHKKPDTSGKYVNVCLKCKRFIWARFKYDKFNQIVRYA